MYSNILEKISVAVEKVGNEQLDTVVEELKKNLGKKHNPKILVVSDHYGKNAVIKRLGNVQQEMEIRKDVQDSACLSGDLDVIETDDKQSQKNLSLKFLQNDNKIVYWCAQDILQLDESIITEYDFILLFTNATMALPQKEKKWLKEVVNPFFGGDRVAVALYLEEFLNTEEDKQDVLETVMQVCNSINSNIKVIQDASNVCSEIEQMDVYSEEMQQKRQSAIIRYYISVIEKTIQTMMELGKVDIEALKNNVKGIEKECRDIELAGKLTIDNTIDSFYSGIKMKIYDAAEKYNEDAYKSICSRIEVTKNVKADAANIEPYLKSIWENFERQISVKMAKGQEEISKELEAQIEADCNRIISYLDLPSGVEVMGIVDKWYLKNRKRVFQDYIQDSDKKDKMLSKGMLVASIALAFVNPVWGITALVGTKLYQSYKDKGDNEIRTQVLGSLFAECNQIKNQVLEQVNVVVERIKNESKQNIAHVYDEIIMELMGSVHKMVDSIEEMKKQTECLMEITQKDIPEIKAFLK